MMKIVTIADIFERAYSDLISELNENNKLKSFMKLKNTPELDYIYKLRSKLDISVISTFFRGTFKVSRRRKKRGRREEGERLL